MPRSYSVFPGIRRLFGVESKGLDGRALTSRRAYTVPGQPYHPDWDVDRAVREGYQWNPYVFRAVEVLAQNEGARRVVLREGDPDDGRILPREETDANQRSLLRVFNRRANPWEVAPVFRHRMVAQYALSSRGVFVEAIRNRRDGLWGAILLDPDQVEIVPTMIEDSKGRPVIGNPIGTFKVQRNTLVNGTSSTFTDYVPPWDPEADSASQPSGIVWVRSPHPTLMMRGMSPIEAAGLSADLDRHARLYNRRFLMQDGRPGGILALKGTTDEPTQQRLQARFAGGPEVAGRTTVIEADEMQWIDTSGTPRDTQWGDTMDRMRREISIAFGVPESVLGDASGRTFDNADAEYAGFWEHTMLPMLRMLDAQLDILTPGGYGDDLYFTHDVSDVYVLGRHKRAEVDRAMAQQAAGLITVDDVRETMEREPLDIPATRVLYLPAGKIVADDETPAHDGDREAVAALPMMGTPQPADVEAEARAGAELGSGIAARRADNAVSAFRVAARTDRRDLTAAGQPEVKELEGEQSRAREWA